MPVEQRPIHFRASFDQAAEDYDAARPGYPAELIADIVTLATLPFTRWCTTVPSRDGTGSSSTRTTAT